MPRPIFNTDRKQEQQFKLDLQPAAKTKTDPVMLDRRLRQKRSGEYVNAIKKLDVGGHTMNKSQFDAFVEAVEKEFPDVPFEDRLIGIVAQCFLGEPYEVHTLDMAGNIITHYKTSQSMPPLLERARGMALYSDYAFIEVYVNALRPVKVDGTVAVTGCSL